MTYIIIDSMNMFSRAKHAVKGPIDLKIGMAMHVMFNSIKKAWNDFGGTHVVFCFEGRSWRKDFYKPYKVNRAAARAALSPKEQEEERVFFEAFNDFKDFIAEKTNCTVLQHPVLEADDLIAGFIQHHPNSNHVIISTDTDFHQLLAANVKQFNGVTEETYTITGILDKRGKLVVDKKTGEPKDVPNPQWLLFEKCIRGDKTDWVFSAYPGVREKGTKTKVGLREAFDDRNSKGWAWNNLMLQRWVDHEGVEHRVMNDYERNRRLIDLSYQPDDIREIISQVINENKVEKNNTQVGVRLLKFCQIYDLKRVSDSVQQYAPAFQAKYQEE